MISAIHQGSCVMRASPRRRAGGRATCSSAARTVPFGSLRETRARRRDRRPVRAAPRPRRRARSRARVRRRAASSSTGSGRWNWSSGTRSTAGPEKSGRYVTSRRPRDAVAARCALRRLRPARRSALRATAAARCSPIAANGEPVVDERRQLLEHDRRVRRDVDAEALAELRDPRELVRRRRHDGAAQPLEPALEVDVRPLALEVARPREQQVGERRAPGARTSRTTSTCSRLLGERAHVGVRERLVAGDDEQRDRVGLLGLFLVGRRGPRLADAARVRRAREVEGGPDAEPLGVRRERRVSPSAPDQIRIARSAPRTFSSSSSYRISAPFRRAARSQRSTIGARSATGSSPRTTITSASRIDESGRRKPSSARAFSTSGMTAACAPSPRRRSFASAYACSTVSEPESAVTMCVPACAQQPLRLVERVVPRHRLEAPARRAAAAAR